MITLPFLLVALVTLVGAVAAMSLRNLVHCALCLVLTFAGLAGLFLQLEAEFVGFAQILVYVGAVAILIVFAILLTRSSEVSPGVPAVSASWWSGVLIALAVGGSLAAAVTASVVRQRGVVPAPRASVAEIGARLVHEFVLPLEVIGLLLTAAMIGAVIIALPGKRTEKVAVAGVAGNGGRP